MDPRSADPLRPGAARARATAQETASFEPQPVSVRDARRLLRRFLTAHGDDALVDAAELALSEVVTNVVLHAHTPFEVTLALHAGRGLRVAVTDRSVQLPAQRLYTAQATTGRGMELIAALTDECGVEVAEHGGKTVWFEVRPPAEGERAEAPATRWTIADDQATPTDGARDGAATVVLPGLPPTLWLAAREHHEAMLRELCLYGAAHPDKAVPAEQIALADRSRAWISNRLLAKLDALSVAGEGPHRALPAGHPSRLPDTPPVLDLDLELPVDAAAAFAALQDVLDSAERLAVAGMLLARPGLPEIVEVRDWVCEQVIAQLRGVAASPWTGPSNPHGDASRAGRAEPEFPDWDAAAVFGSTRGVIAADDANRIIAVSRPLADALGWRTSELVGRRVVALIPPELREAHVAGFTRHLTTGESHVIGVPLRLPVLRADGTRLECDFLIEQTALSQGRHVYLAWIEPVPDRDPGPSD